MLVFGLKTVRNWFRMFEVGKIYSFLDFRGNCMNVFWLILSEKEGKYNVLITEGDFGKTYICKVEPCYFKCCEELI